jgi:hypothetical protein
LRENEKTNKAADWNTPISAAPCGAKVWGFRHIRVMPGPDFCRHHKAMLIKSEPTKY